MFFANAAFRKLNRLLAVAGLSLALAACNVGLPGGTSGPRIGAGSVNVALLVPYGSVAAGDDLLARNLEQAARL